MSPRWCDLVPGIKRPRKRGRNKFKIRVLPQRRTELVGFIADLLRGTVDWERLSNSHERPSEGLSNTVLLHQSDVLRVEKDAKLSVNFTVTPNEDIVEDDYSWDNEITDPSVRLDFGVNTEEPPVEAFGLVGCRYISQLWRGNKACSSRSDHEHH
ncbi:unnamed protein product [Arabis nemorensis]|uniref:Uncharacterized protein n=1 Tax=Arabis nemorensis TaxID=586526 RepID=A0A565BY84_9BRAS|nr:unnamed protein product [Arabis nemorensis]